jgi:putative ABC transport system permease protein
VNRRRARGPLAAPGITPSRLRIRDAVREALTNIARTLSRTILTSLGTALRQAGLMWAVGGGQPLTASRVDVAGLGAPAGAGVQVTVASPRALAAVDASASSGRLYDQGMDRRGDRVALLSQAAAISLGITRVDLSPTLYVDAARFTIIGIVRSGPLESQLTQGVIIAPGAAGAIPGDGAAARQIVVRTAPGAAQLIGRQGPYAIDPDQPSRIAAQVPIDPSQLRNQVSSQLTVLLLAVAIVTLVVGVISITNITLLSVMQRRPEIGLRRSVGAAPRHIAALIVGEASLVGVIGGLLGTSGGVFITALVSASRGWAPTLAPAFILAAPLMRGVTGALAGLYPAWRASRISPISALQR